MNNYIDQEDILITINAKIEYAKLTGNFDKVTALSEIRELIEKMPYIEVPHCGAKMDEVETDE